MLNFQAISHLCPILWHCKLESAYCIWYFAEVQNGYNFQCPQVEKQYGGIEKYTQEPSFIFFKMIELAGYDEKQKFLPKYVNKL